MQKIKKMDFLKKGYIDFFLTFFIVFSIVQSNIFNDKSHSYLKRNLTVDLVCRVLLLRKACLGWLPFANEDAESLPSYSAKSISGGAGESETESESASEFASESVFVSESESKSESASESAFELESESESDETEELNKIRMTYVFMITKKQCMFLETFSRSPHRILLSLDIFRHSKITLNQRNGPNDEQTNGRI